MSNEKFSPEEQHEFISWERNKVRGKMAMGALIIFFGLMYFLKELDVNVPRWAYHWSSFMVAIGIIVLIKHKFQNLFGFFLIIAGVMFNLATVFNYDINLKLMFPLLAIILGVSMVVRPKRKEERDAKKWEKVKSKGGFMGMESETISPEDFVDGVSIFGSIRKQVSTKNFKGADLLTLFGGTELNLTQASFDSKAVVELTTVFGGAEIIVPADWHIKTEMVSVFGGVEDNRYQGSPLNENSKVLILRGTCVFGGVEIKSYGV